MHLSLTVLLPYLPGSPYGAHQELQLPIG
uniref:Uncharacterized protein n=1 Tax=Arundo donax TaxID=35708 RepID=A0A0A9A991_ARUDO